MTSAWISPDTLLSMAAQRQWSLSLSDMSGSDDSTTPEFAFEAPNLGDSADPTLKTPSFDLPTSFSFQQPFNYNPSAASSFSSSAASFSSTDALPAISRDFVRPSTSETRRPATAGGALQTRSPFHRTSLGKPETIDEEAGMFSNPNPFGAPDKELEKIPSQDMDPHFVPSSRRASEPQSQFQPLNVPSYTDNSQQHQSFPLTSAPAHVTQFGLVPNIHSQMQQLNRPVVYDRPQTSDGLPSYGSLANASGISLPSARTLVNQIDPNGYPQQQYFNQTSLPYRDNRSASLGELHQHSSAYTGSRHYSLDKSHYPDGSSKPDYTFVPLGGPTPKKRPRRRYDEIERLYSCGWNGCEKSYGTLNHLNAHVAMQKHGDKRLPSEFKDMRKAWRKKKREQAAADANAHYMANSSAWAAHRPSLASSSTDSEFDRRDSASSAFSSNSEYSHRGSMMYAPPGPGYSWGGAESSRPNTSSSIASSADGRFPMAAPPNGYAMNAHTHNAHNTHNIPVVRRPSAPTHLPMPAVHPQGFRQPEGDHPTPTQQNPFPQPPRPASSQASQGQGAFPFSTLTSPMPMAAGGAQGYASSQFAFQR